MYSPLSILSSGIKLFKDDFWRGVGCMSGAIPTHEWPLSETDNEAILRAIEASGGFGFFVCRTPKPGLFGFQRAIDGVTRSGAGHAGLLIGGEIGMRARMTRPGLLIKKPSPRWKNSPTHPDNIAAGHPWTWTADGRPVPWVEGIPATTQRFEIVESQVLVAINSLTASVDKGEQVIIFTNPKWSMKQKVAMACEAYSWVGEPYDPFEIGAWFLSWMINPSEIKACSTLVQKCISAGDQDINLWAKFHHLDPERVAPRDNLAYGIDRELKSWFIKCDLTGVVNTETA